MTKEQLIEAGLILEELRREDDEKIKSLNKSINYYATEKRKYLTQFLPEQVKK